LFVEAISSNIFDDLILFLNEPSSIYHSLNEEKWKVSPETLMWSNITIEEMIKVLELIILMGNVRKENIRDFWSTDPQFPNSIFLSL